MEEETKYMWSSIVTFTLGTLTLYWMAGTIAVKIVFVVVCGVCTIIFFVLGIILGIGLGRIDEDDWETFKIAWQETLKKTG